MMAVVGSRAVIVEDHDALSRGLELVLGKAGIDVVGSARTEQEGYEIILRERPGLAVVDIGLEDGSGVELARRLAESEPDLGVLIYTGLDDEGLLREAIDSGARGFALKAGPARDLVAAARAVASGGTYVDPHLTFVLGESATGEVATLSPREREVMAALAEGLKAPQVAERLGIAPDTVRTHVENAMQKLDARTRAHAIAIALQHGLIEIPDSTY
ncbi:MAG: response regulator [Thermoleophilaceae bacterium]